MQPLLQVLRSQDCPQSDFFDSCQLQGTRWGWITCPTASGGPTLLTAWLGTSERPRKSNPKEGRQGWRRALLHFHRATGGLNLNPADPVFQTNWTQVNALLAFRSANHAPRGYHFQNWHIPPDTTTEPHFYCNWTGVNCSERTFDIVGLQLSNPADDLPAGASVWHGSFGYPIWGKPASLHFSLNSSESKESPLGNSIPPQVGDLTALTALDVSYNSRLGDPGSRFLGMVGQLPVEMSKLTNLERLDVQYNSFSGPFPEFLTGLTRLSYINFANNLFSGSLPQSLWELPRLSSMTSLTLEGNNLTGFLPSTLASLKELQELTISNTPISGSFPDSLSNLRRLSSIQLKNVNITGRFPDGDWWGKLRELQFLYLENIPLSGQLPQSMPQSLLDLRLKGTGLTGGIPEALLSSLCGRKCEIDQIVCSPFLSLDIEDNPLGGPFPKGVQNCWLLYLSLANNSLQGHIPPAVFTGLGLQLEELNISNNNLTGTLPVDLLQKHTAMKTLDLSNNRFTGPAPLLSCSIAHFDIHNNGFNGSISSILGNRKDCWPAGADLSNNQISGSLPSNWSKGMASLNLQGNIIPGPVPKALGEHCKDLLSFVASRTLLTDPLPSTLDCPLLTRFDVSQNPGIHSLPAPQNCSITSLNASGCGITGPIPPAFMKQCRKIRTLDLSHNSISGHIPSPSGGQLHLLDLSGNELQSMSADLLQQAVVVDLSNNDITGIPPKAKIGPQLQSLNISHNSISGQVPLELLRSTVLSTLDLSHNDISGIVDPPRQTLSLEEPTLSGTLNLSHNSFAEFPSALLQLTDLKHLDLSSNRLRGPIPWQMVNLVNLTFLSLANNSIQGTLDPSLAPPNLPASLKVLDLSHNHLTGFIPFGFSSLSKADPLSLNLSSNNFSGPVPGGECGPLSLPPVNLSGNSQLCGGGGHPPCPCRKEPCWCGGLCQPSCPVPPSNNTTVTIIAAIVGGVALLALIAAGIGLWLWMRSKDEWSGAVLLKFSEKQGPVSVRQLLHATGNFSEEHALGRGGFGTVYRATLPGGTEVAIKRLAAGSSQGEDEFRAEIEFLGNISHRNLVKLLAAVVAPPPKNEHLLVYQFMPGGALDSILRSSMPPDSPFRKFPLRHSIALDVARGLKYLHHDCQPGIIHRDMKPANVLLDEQLNARIADFGLAKSADLERTHLTDVGVFGTAGYVAPEYTTLGRMSFRSDVYAYGVTLIQLMTGREATEEEIAEKGLRRWAGEGAKIIDQRLELRDENEEKMVLAAVKVGVLCVARVPVDRPTMVDVVRMLENLEEFASCCQAGPSDQ